MSIPEAYCIECKESISISKAVGISAINKGKRLNFLCADDSCREAFKARIVGVNYRSRGTAVDSTIQAKQAHFRIEYRDAHRLGCPSVSSDRARVLPVKKRRGVLAARRGSKIDSRQIVEQFEPFEVVEEDSGGQITAVELKDLQAAKNRRARDEIIKRAFNENPVRTSQLEKLVDDYEWLKSAGLDSVAMISGVSHR